MPRDILERKQDYTPINSYGLYIPYNQILKKGELNYG